MGKRAEIRAPVCVRKKEKEAQANLPVSTTDTKTLSRLQLSGTGVQHDWTGMINTASVKLGGDLATGEKCQIIGQQ